MPPHSRRAPAPKIKDLKKTTKRLLGYLVVYKWLLLVMLLALLITTALKLISPYLIKIAIDDYLVALRMKEIGPLILIMVIVYLSEVILNWFGSYFSHLIAAKTSFQMRAELFGKYQKLPIKYFDRQPIGELMSRITNDVDAINTALAHSIAVIVNGTITLVGTMSIMLWINWQLALATFVAVPLSFMVSALIGKKSHHYFSQQQEDIAKINGFAEESISGIKTVKIFSQEKAMSEQFAVHNEAFMKSSRMAQLLGMLIPVTMAMVNNFGFVVVSLFGGWLGVQKLISLGGITSFFQYKRQFARPIDELAQQYNQLQLALAAAERVFAVLDEEEEVVGIEAGEFTLAGQVTLDQIDFSYLPDKPVLRDISFAVKSGQTIALVGPTGSGKTTIVNLLMRFYDLNTNSGTIKFDHRSINDFHLSNLRSQIGMVLQDTHLFKGTIAQNLRFGQLDATQEEIEAAARKACVDKFIQHLPHGYQTQLSTGGENLSQGQRQLLAIARAILRDPAILILDEATSNVDTRTEIEVQKAILKVRSGRTAIIIAHRLSTIKDADLILIIKEGRIIERGNHPQLLKANGFYASLWQGQYQDDDIRI